jgi:hypothetical protein
MSAYRLVLFLYVIIIGFSTLAADSIPQLTETLFPHLRYYSYKGDLLNDLRNCLTSSDVATAKKIYGFLHKAADIDKDYRAAAALKMLRDQAVFKPFIKQDIDDVYAKAFELGRQIDEEKNAIERSIFDACAYIRRQQGDIYKQALTWLEKPLPSDRIKCCIRELKVQENHHEVQEIINILSQTSFGKNQVQKGLKK